MKKTIVLLAMALMLPWRPHRRVAAQDWPQQPIRIIVSFGPGGGADIIGRILADSMQSQARQAGGDRKQARRRRHHRQ